MNYRKQLTSICLAVAFLAGVAYDTLFIIPHEGLRAIVAVTVLASLAVAFLLEEYPPHVIQPVIVATIPLHLFSMISLGFCVSFHGDSRLGEMVAYTLVAYATYVLVPVWLLLDRRLFDVFVKVVAVACTCWRYRRMSARLGIDSIGGIPLSNKYAYSSFSGIIASGGIFEHAEGLALQMAVGVFCCFYALRKSGNWFYGLCLVMVSAGLVVSQGRGAFWAS